jgi:CheY-like chemotaxis protein
MEMGQPASPQGSILVVDDNPDIRDSLTEILHEEGYRTIEAADGPSALAALTDPAHPIGLVLLDLVMPGMNGIEVLDRKGADPALRDIPVILLTGYTEAQLKLHAGVIALIPKGTRTEHLLWVVRAALQRSAD